LNLEQKEDDMKSQKPYIKYPHRTTSETWTVPQICKAYSWPTGLPGGGPIAIIELGGGWQKSDMNKFFRSVKQPLPQINDISVDGTKNNFGADGDADGEVALDIQISAAAYYYATGKPAVINVYWASDIAPAVVKATQDGNAVCSISWGANEPAWLQQDPKSLDVMEAAAAAAVKAGMTVFAASGDNDSADADTGSANVDAPASCPSVIGCGGTTKTRQSETVWNENPGDADGEGTGGGYSKHFEMPPWQVGAPSGPGRMVPDVAANADPNTGYIVTFAGTSQPIGGTSAVAPLYAGLFAAFGSRLGSVGPRLWACPLAFNDVTVGDNGFYRAGPGPDPCTGLGSPIGTRLAKLFAPGVKAAGTQVRIPADAPAVQNAF
jgi:kumamolisin